MVDFLRKKFNKNVEKLLMEFSPLGQYECQLRYSAPIASLFQEGQWAMPIFSSLHVKSCTIRAASRTKTDFSII